MAVPHTSPIGDDAEPCDYQTGRDGCSSRPAHQISPAMERLVVEKLCFQSADTLAPTCLTVTGPGCGVLAVGMIILNDLSQILCPLDNMFASTASMR